LLEKKSQPENKKVLSLVETPFHGRCTVSFNRTPSEDDPLGLASPTSKRTPCLTEIDQNIHISTGQVSLKKSVKSTGPRDTSHFKGSMSHWVTVFVRLLSFLFFAPQVGLPSIPHISQTFYSVLLRLKTFKINKIYRNRCILTRRNQELTSFCCFSEVLLNLMYEMFHFIDDRVL
jgi:hypothetical protein